MLFSTSACRFLRLLWVCARAVSTRNADCVVSLGFGGWVAYTFFAEKPGGSGMLEDLGCEGGVLRSMYHCGRFLDLVAMDGEGRWM